MEADNTYCVSNMQVGCQESNMLLGGSDHPDVVKDETSTENCSVSSSSQTCENIVSSKYVSSDAAAVHGINSKYAYTDAVFPSDESTSERPRSKNMSGGEDCSLGALHKGDISPLVGAVATLDIFSSNKIDVGNLISASSKEECELQESGFSSLHHNQVCKIPCSSKDLVYKSTDKATEEKEVYQEMKNDDACSSQLRSSNFSDSSTSVTSVRSNLCIHDSHISKNNNPAVKDCVNKSPDSRTVDISLLPLDMPFAFNCSEDAATPSFFGCKNKVETVSLSGGIVTHQSEVNCVTLPSEILVPPVITKFPCSKLEVIKLNVDSEEEKAECYPSESANVSQTYTNTTGVTVISENKETAINTFSIEATETCVSFSGIVPRELNDIVSMSTSQPDVPHTSVGISTSAPDIATCGSFEPFLSQNMGLSKPLPLPSAGIFHCNTSRSKTDSISDSFTSWLQPQRDSFVNTTQNFGSVPKSVTNFTNSNKLFQNVADKTKGSVSFSLKSEQDTALGVSPSMPASKSSFAVDVPIKLTASPDSCILKSTNESSITVSDSLSRDLSVFSGVQFCTLSSPISSSSISKSGDTNFHLGTTSSDLEFSLGFGASLKCGAPCTESSMDTALSSMGKAGSTCLKPGFIQSGVNVYSNTVDTLRQNNGSFNIKTDSSGAASSAVISCGILSFSALTTQSSLSLPNSSVVSTGQLGQVPRIENTTSAVYSALGSPILTTKTSVCLPNSSVVSTGQFGQVSRIENTTFAVPSTNITAGPSSFYYSNQRSSLVKGTEFSRFSHCSSKPVFRSDFNFPKYESVKDTSVRKDIFGTVFQVNSPGNQSSTEKASNRTVLGNGSSTLFTFGSTEMKHDNTNIFYKDFMWKPIGTEASNNFNTDIINNRFTFGIPSPTTSSSVLFNFSGSDKTSKRNSKLHLQGRSKFHLQGRSSNSAQTRSCFHSIIHKPSVPFKAVIDADTQIKNGVVRLIAVQHQYITAMPEYSSLSFEELRLQYDKYNSSEQTECEAIMVNKEVQTTERFQKDGSHLADMWKILECPVCLEIITSPVLQCERGHHICNHCWKRVISCPLCKCFKSKTRNYVAEAMIEKLLLPCKYRVDGCSETMHQVDKAMHEKTCLFRACTCLVDDCNRAHSFKDMMVHLKTSHSHLITRNYLHIPKRQKFTHIMSKHSLQSLVHVFDLPDWGLFILCHKGSEQNTCLWVQVMNTDTTDTKFLCSIELADMQKLRSVSYQGPVVPMHTVINEQQHDCLVLTDLLLGTLKKNSGFCITVSIWEF